MKIWITSWITSSVMNAIVISTWMMLSFESSITLSSPVMKSLFCFVMIVRMEVSDEF